MHRARKRQIKYLILIEEPSIVEREITLAPILLRDFLSKVLGALRRRDKFESRFSRSGFRTVDLNDNSVLDRKRGGATIDSVVIAYPEIRETGLRPGDAIVAIEGDDSFTLRKLKALGEELEQKLENDEEISLKLAFERGPLQRIVLQIHFREG